MGLTIKEVCPWFFDLTLILILADETLNQDDSVSRLGVQTFISNVRSNVLVGVLPILQSHRRPCQACDSCDVGKAFRIIEENTTDIGANVSDISCKLNSKYIITTQFMPVTNY